MRLSLPYQRNSEAQKRLIYSITNKQLTNLYDSRLASSGPVWQENLQNILDITHCLSYSVLSTVYEAQHDPHR